MGDAVEVQIEFLERDRFLPKIPRDPIVEIHRDKKESGSTQRGLSAGTGFKEFRQTP